MCFDMPVPTHLQSILLPKGDNNENSAYGQLVCNCGNNEFLISANDENTLVEAKCTVCRNQHVIFDAEKYGWDGFVCNMELGIDKEVNPTSCTKCRHNEFNVFITIRSQGKEDFVQESGLKDSHGNVLSKEDWVNAFEWIRIDLECSECKQQYLGWLDFETM